MGPVTSQLPNKPVQPHEAQMEQGQTEVPLSQLQQVSEPKIWAAPPVPYSKHLQLLVRPSLLPYLQHLWEAQ